MLSVVFSREDAFVYTKATGDAERHVILNRSEMSVDGKDFGLALGQRDSLNVEAVDRSVPRQPTQESSQIMASHAPATVSPPAAYAAVANTAPTPAHVAAGELRLLADGTATNRDIQVPAQGGRHASPIPLAQWGKRTLLN